MTDTTKQKYKVTISEVALNKEDRYYSNYVFEQIVEDLDIKAVVAVVNGLNLPTQLGAYRPMTKDEMDWHNLQLDKARSSL